MKKLWESIRNIFGLNRNSKYVKNYLNDANMRSGVFMSAIIVVLEIWLLFRQLDKYIIPTLNNPENTKSWFQVVFQNTSNFWLLLSFGGAMMMYAILYRSKIRSFKKIIPVIVFAAVSLVFVALMPFEFIFSSRPITGVTLFLLITFYASVFAFDVAVVIASIYRYKGGANQNLTSVLIISLFALVCLVFGIKVSYADFASVRTNAAGELIPNPDYKQIICFLMMAIYVGCLLIWKPYISVGILGVVFLGFYLLLEKTVDIRAFPEGDQVNYITFFISLTMVCISIYDQRISEATKDEELELLATRDTLTDLFSFEYFTTLVAKKIIDENIQENDYAFMFLNITNFKVFNDQRGFEEGNKFLKETGEIIMDTFRLGLVSRQSDDHFVVFAKAVDLESSLDSINNRVGKLDLDIRPGMKTGIYLYRDRSEDVHQSIEKARYACMEIENQPGHSFIYYDREMHDNYRMVQYIVRHIDEAVEKGYLKPYYQPVVWSKDNTLCGAEALARWVDPKYGFLSPAKFVPALENAQLIHKLDVGILKLVCKDLRHNMDNGLPVLPVSINFSRLDFVLMDIVTIINDVVTEYGIPKDLIHVEITESALMNDGDVLKAAMDKLHEFGFSIWLDDFGSGYSSFNVLKDYKFDVLKLDMAFLIGFESNDKSKTLIKSVVSMAEQIGIRTLCEGVETKEESGFLKEVKCERQQGYLFGKPLSYDEIKAKIINKELVLAKGIINADKIK